MTTPTALATDQQESTRAVSAATVRALDRISVGRPYFGFHDIEIDGDGTIHAGVPSSPPAAPERGAIAADQVARHLAILGSCAAALSRDDDTRHHYLATHADYQRCAGSTTEPVDRPMRAIARSSWVDKRTARAEMELRTDSGELLNRLAVHYAVMKPRMFDRLNPDVTTSAASAVPATGLQVIDHGHVLRACGPIDERMCAGHFPDRPTAPVALVMGQLVATAADAMANHLGLDVDYVVEGGTVDATGLARAGQDLVLEANHVETTGGVGVRELSCRTRQRHSRYRHA